MDDFEVIEKLDERAFIEFWCIYLISLAQEQFIKGPRYTRFLEDAGKEIEAFQAACLAARIPARSRLEDG